MLAKAVTEKATQLIPLDSTRGEQVTRRALFGLDSHALETVMAGAGEPSWRGRQIAQAIYNQRVRTLDQVTTLSRDLRARLAGQGWEIGRPPVVQVFRSVDGTERYLVEGQPAPGRAPDTVETVWMPEGDDGEAGDGSDADAPTQPRAPSFSPPLAKRVGDPENQPAAGTGTHGPADHPQRLRRRATICISSQVGCAVNCQFCLTAKLGLQRNLTAGEIAGQAVAVLDRHGVEVGKDRVNLVFMGMGEPFLNYDNFMAAVRLLVEEVGLSPQRMTVSTSGIVPGIERFALESSEVRPKLAISLNAPNDAIRSEVMPVNRKWPIEAVVDAVRGVKLRPRERITFEYVLLGGITDQRRHAREVARLVRRTGLPAKVNLIAWNPGPGIAYTMPKPDDVDSFRETLIAEGIPAYLRRPRGRDIYAACGQLKRTVEAETGKGS
jgi:23S rRNA (adenine2503-C2)-methyltransferase